MSEMDPRQRALVNWLNVHTRTDGMIEVGSSSSLLNVSKEILTVVDYATPRSEKAMADPNPPSNLPRLEVALHDQQVLHFCNFDYWRWQPSPVPVLLIKTAQGERTEIPAMNIASLEVITKVAP